ncbi:MAG: hypothetical protein ACI87E_000711 [Mariniblastus sp.]|jgi:hypothetical protein
MQNDPYEPPLHPNLDGRASPEAAGVDVDFLDNYNREVRDTE